MGPAERSGRLNALVRMVADRAADPRTHRTKICVLLGAGADISSGGLTFAQLKRRAVEDFMKRRVFDLTSETTLDRDFDDLFLGLEPDERALLVEVAFAHMQQLEPSEAYKLLVLLAEAGGVDAIITTNFDVMLERSQEILGRDLFQVFAPGIARPDLRSYGRYDPPKKPYLKLHGDLSSRAVVFLTRAELASTSYDEPTLSLLSSILRSHDLIIAGYGGFDGALAEVIGDAIADCDSRVYWCNPSPPTDDSPLARRLAARFAYVSLPFDELMVALARPVLERPSLSSIEPTFIQRLLDWRADYCNREYVALYTSRPGSAGVRPIIRRRKLEDALTGFLGSSQPMTLVTGPSGFGKTTLGVRLLEAWRLRRSTKLLLVRARSLPDSGDIERYIGEQLSGLGSRGSFSLFRLETWLRANDLQLVVFIDGLNEFSPEFSRCIALLRNLLRLCYFLPEVASAIRIVATVRQETWNAMLPHLDLGQLERVFWSPAGPGTIGTVACEAFSDDELQEAVERLQSPRLSASDLDALPATSIEQLRDPYLFGILAEGLRQGLPTIPAGAHYQRAFAAKLKVAGSASITARMLEEAFAVVAAGCLEGGRHRFRESDVGAAGERAELIRLARDLNIIRDAEQGFLQFEHERTFEYFLATAIAMGIGPPLETLADLREYLVRFKTDGRALAAARLHIELNPDRGLSLVAGALRSLDDPTLSPQILSAEALFEFGREGLTQLAEHGEPLAATYLSDAIDAGREGRIGELHLKAAVQAAATLPAAQSIPLLARAQHPASPLPSVEAHIYAIDRLAKLFLQTAGRDVDLLTDPPYASYFSSPSINLVDQLGRIAALAMQLGPDNTHAAEYGAVSAAMADALTALTKLPRPPGDAARFTAFFLRNCDRLLFNSTQDGVRRFFGNSRRDVFLEIIAKLEGGGVLSLADFEKIEPYTQSISFDLEYQLSIAVFIASSLNDVAQTLALAEQCFKRFDRSANPVQVDFLDEVLVYLHVLHGLEYDEQRFGWWERKVLQDWPDVLLFRPGLLRGEIRGFTDPFDKIFEDGFSVIYPYGILSPSKRRRSLHHREYLRSASSKDGDSLPFYTSWLQHFLAEQKIDEALQMLQGIAGVIVPWPLEGLPTLRPAIGHPDPRVRRAVVRILAEAYNRHPTETLRFLRAAGVALTDDEFLEIKVRRDARLGRRQIAEEEWARLLHFLLQFEGARALMFGALKDIVAAGSPEDAVGLIFQRLGWT